MSSSSKTMGVKFTFSVLALALATLALPLAPAMAHTDPPGATQTGTAQQLGVFSDAICTTLVTSVMPGETVYLQATLLWTGLPAASFEAGRWRLAADDGQGGPVTEFVDLGAVPCVADPINSVDDGAMPGGRGACAGQDSSFISTCESFTVPMAADPTMNMLFEAIYGDANPGSPDTAYAHLGTNDQPGVSSSVTQVVPIDPVVPTLGEVGRLLLAVLLLAGLGYMLYRRQATA